VKFVLREAIVTGELINTLHSCCNFWIGVVRDAGERAMLVQVVAELEAEAKQR
jgi:hypothetical protein